LKGGLNWHAELPDAAVHRIAEHIQRGCLVGRWENRTSTQEVRKDGHLETKESHTIIWTRSDFGVQYKRNWSWTSYVGTTTNSGEFGSGSFGQSIESEHRTANDAFVTDPNAVSSGSWSVDETANRLVLNGSGFVEPGGAVEDDDLLCHCSGGPQKSVKFDADLDVLRTEYTHTASSRLSVSHARDWSDPPGWCAAEPLRWMGTVRPEGA